MVFASAFAETLNESRPKRPAKEQMKMAVRRPRRLVALTGLALACALTVWPAAAQEQFFTQSGGHGIENAKTNARLTKTEKDVDALNAQVAKVKPHAYVDIPSCADTGAKLRWVNGAWDCGNETDPTVQGWAKKALPQCGAGQILNVSGDGFGCTSSNFLTNETDPTVQSWAKSALPSCGSGEVLTTTNGAFSCKVDDKGLLNETDPFVYDFARNDKATIADCNVGQKLTMNGARLVCAPDAVGVTSETDPFVQHFARTDISGSILSACGAGKALTAVNSGGDVLLSCINVAGAGQTAINLADLGDVNVAAKASGTVLIYNSTSSKWVAGTSRDASVQDFARQAITACAAGELVVYDGTALKCVASSNVVSTSTKLSELTDVSLSSLANHNILHYDGTRWVNDNHMDGVIIGASVPAGASFTTVVAGTIGTGNLAASGYITAPTIYSSGSVVQGNEVVSGDLHVGGTLYVSGGQSIDGVLFANGGVSATGAVSASHFYGDGSGLTGTFGGNVSWSNVLGVPMVLQDISNSTGSVSVSSIYVSNGTVDNDLHVKGNLYVSGSQTFDGVTFANGGVSATGTVTATNFSGNMSGANVKVADGTSGSLIFRDANGSLTANNSILVSSSNGSIGIVGGSSMPSYVGNDSLYAAGNIYIGNSGWFFSNAGQLKANIGNFGTKLGIGTQGTPSATLHVVGNGLITSDLTILGNLNVSGSQTFDGVTFANGGISSSGTISASHFTGDGSGLYNVYANAVSWTNITGVPAGIANVSNSTGSVTVTSINVSSAVANSLGVGNVLATGTISSAAMATSNGLVQGDLKVTGNLYVSGSQSFDGVTFANGGVSSSGTVSASHFSGDGSGLSGVVASNVDWYNISRTPVVLQNISNSTGSVTVTSVEANLVSATGAAGTVTSTYGYFKYISGTTIAGTFVGDGSGLTGVVASSGDRIVSGTTKMIVISDTGFISLTQAGTNTGWFDPSRGLVTIGLSSTGPISGTNIYLGSGGSTSNVAVAVGAVNTGLYSPGASDLRLVANGNSVLRIAGSYANTTSRLMVGSLASVPSQTLHVNGSALITSWTGINFSSAANVTPTAPLEVSGTVSATQFVGQFVGDGSGLTGVVASSGDRIVSGTTKMIVISDTGYISLTQAGTNTGWFDPSRGLVTIGISSTGPISGTSLYSSGLSNLAGGLLTTNISLTNNLTGFNLISSSTGGTVSATNGYFANISATSLMVNGAPVVGGSPSWYVITDIPTQVQAVSDSGNINLTNLTVTGTVSGATLISTASGGTVSATNVYAANISGTTGTFSSIGAGNINASGQVTASTVTANLISTTNNGTVSGTYGYFKYISGTSIYGTFVGDGSGLTNVGAAMTDRVISGTNAATSLVAVSATGIISITQAGTNTAYFHPQLGLVTIGISSTGTISGTNLYSSGLSNLAGGLLTTNISLTNNLTGFNLISSSTGGTVSATNGYFANISATSLMVNGAPVVGGSPSWYVITDIPTQVQAVSDSGSISMTQVSATNLYGANVSATTGTFSSIGAGNINASGQVTASTVTANLISTTNNGTVSGTYGYFKYISGTNIYGTFVGDGSGLTGVTAASGDRIVSGTTSMLAISDTGYISLTQAGTNTGWFDPSRGLVTIGISSTGVISGTNLYSSGLSNLAGGLLTTNISLTNNLTGFNLISSSLGGTVSATNGYFTNISATNADFKNITVNGAPVAGGSPSWYVLTDIPTQVQAVSDSGSISMTQVSATNLYANSVSGSTGTFNSVGVGNLNASGVISATGAAGTVTATYGYFKYISGTNIYGTFVGDGSGLTGVVASSGDRIVSGTTSMLAISDTGYISLTQAGTNTGWFDPSRGLVTIGISSTGPISGTNLYSSGLSNLAGGLLTTNISLTGNLTGFNYISSTFGGIVSSTYIDAYIVSTTSLYVNGVPVTGDAPDWYALTNIPMQVQAVSDSGSISMTQVSATNLYANSVSGSTGTFSSIGAGNINASGQVTASTVTADLISTTNSGTVSGTYGYFKYISGSSIYGTFVGDGSGLTGVVASSGDRIVSGTTSMLAISNTGYISLTQAGTNTGWFDPSRGLVTIGISSTGTISGTNLYSSGLSNLAGGLLTTNISLTGNLTGFNYISSSIGGTVSATNGYFANISATIGTFSSIGAGNINASGQVTASTVTADLISTTNNGTVSGSYGYFHYVSGTTADFSALTVNGAPVSGASPSWYVITDIPTQVQAVSDSGSISLTQVSATNLYAANVSGTVGTFSSIGAGNINASGQVTASTVTADLISTTNNGTVSGTYGYFKYISGSTISGKFVGDGSGLTGVTAGATDRIVSGTTSMIAISDTGYISLTQAGSNTGWFDPSRGLVTIGVSTTSTVSATSGYFNSYVGVGTSNPIGFYNAQVVINTARLNTSSLYLNNPNAGSASIFSIVGPSSTDINTGKAFAFTVSGESTARGMFYMDGSYAMGPGGAAARDLYLSRPVTSTLLLSSDRATGAANLRVTSWTTIANSVTPTAALDVYGTVSASNVYVTGTTGTVSGTYGYFKYISGTSIYGTFVGDGSGLTNVGAASTDRITSGTTSMMAISSTGYISLTQAGTNTGWFDPARGLVAIGVSSTGVVSASGIYSNANATISGTIKMSGTGAETCGAATYGTMRFVDLGGGNFGMQLCRP